jgi:HSP20 family protein
MLEDIWRGDATVAAARFAPRLEVVENEDDFVVTAELPGLEEKDFHVEVHGKSLTLRGEKRNERSGENEGRTWTERSYGEFRRVIELPVEVDSAKTSAAYKNGILAVTLPKAQAAKVRHVPVNAA